MTEQKKTWHDVPMEELVLTAREYPAMQAAIGWNILKHAAACGFRTGAGLLRAIHAHGELLEALEETLELLCHCCRHLNPQHVECTGCQDTEQARAVLAKAAGDGK